MGIRLAHVSSLWCGIGIELGYVHVFLVLLDRYLTEPCGDPCGADRVLDLTMRVPCGAGWLY